MVLHFCKGKKTPPKTKRKKEFYLQRSVYCYYLLACQSHLETENVAETAVALSSVQANGKSAAPPVKAFVSPVQRLAVTQESFV